jgi:peptidoglycan/xylan/chitin deacetylase (PgdA/CDA1 family)
MRSTIVACAILVLLIGMANAEQCPPGALGVSRTLVVDPNEHPRIGSMQYPETLPLNDHEVVLTFDDGPLPRYTSHVLETLASECVKATFFMVGQMARAYPSMARRVYDEGHTVANHTQNHPIRKMSATQAAREIEGGFASLRDAIGDPQAVSPFFRIPGLLRQKSVEQYLAAHGDMTWSADFVADDWTRIKDSEVARRAISRIEARGKGHLAAARHPPANRPRAARNSQRAQEPRLQDRSCGSGNCGPTENRNVRGAMGCPPHARTAYESVNGAHTRSLRQSVRLPPPRGDAPTRCCAAYVRFWHKADKSSLLLFVRFWG